MRILQMMHRMSGQKMRQNKIHCCTLFPSHLWLFVVISITSCCLPFHATFAWVNPRSAPILHSTGDGYVSSGKTTKYVSTIAFLSNSSSRRQSLNFQSVLELSSLSSSATNLVTPVEDPLHDEESRLFYVRPALMMDMGRASKILSDGFFKNKTNFFTYQFERLQTYLSLESTFPKPNSYHEIFVACCTQQGTVWGMVEVDARMKSDRNTARDGPYMCNLAVDYQRQRLGIATALVEQCERQVREWHEEHRRRRIQQPSGEDPTSIQLSNTLCLKVRTSNLAAIQLYTKLGYESVFQETEEKTGETVLLMRKELLDCDLHQVNSEPLID